VGRPFYRMQLHDLSGVKAGNAVAGTEVRPASLTPLGFLPSTVTTTGSPYPETSNVRRACPRSQ
jgi:hypothetical protein